MKRYLSILLALVMMITGFTPAIPAYAAENSNGVAISESMEDLTVKAQNSFGSLIASELESKLNEQEENNGHNIFSIEINGTEAAVSFETVEDCTLVVAIYDETGEKMLSSGSKNVVTEETATVVSIETDSMPQYFYVRGFLVDTDSFRPLCKAYESPNYTKEMQEFLAKTTDDFNADKVLNLDEDKRNNFAVFSESTKVIPESTTANQIVTADVENNVYVIENADSNITSLQTGDVFAQKYDDNNVIIVKVAEIQMNGTTVTITGAETSLEEVFDYVKIDGEVKSEDVVVDTSTCGEGVVYNGLAEREEENVQASGGNEEAETRRVGEPLLDTTVEKVHSMDFVDEKIGSDSNYVKLNGGVDFTIDCSIKIYSSKDELAYVEIKLDYSALANITLSGKVSGEIPLVTLMFSFYKTVNVELTPRLVLDARASIDVRGTLTGTVGFSASTKEGGKNLTTTPRFKAELKAEAVIYVGFALEPKINIFCDEFASVSMTASVGAELKASYSKILIDTEQSEPAILHECKNCISGEISGKYGLSYKVNFLFWEYSDDIIDETVKIADFYYSFDFNEFDFTKCPHNKYKITVMVLDLNGFPISGATVNGQYSTDESGRTYFFLSDGLYHITAQKDGSKGTNDICINGETKSIILKLRDREIIGNNESIRMVTQNTYNVSAIKSNGNLYMWGRNLYGQIGDGTTIHRYIPTLVLEDIESVSLNPNMYVAAITKTGSLYMWGTGGSGALGNGTTMNSYIPVHVLDNVLSIDMDGRTNAAITENGVLYTWGDNTRGQLGNGVRGYSAIPGKILDNVLAVDIGYYSSAALTMDGSLYAWGDTNGLSYGYTESGYSPVKIMENVLWLNQDNGADYKAAIGKDGSLYMWGKNTYGQLGDGTTQDRYYPVKVLENVKSIKIAGNNVAAITKDGSLYMWGENSIGTLGNGTKKMSCTPVKVLDNVVTVEMSSYNTAAITKDGSLYMWGSNYWGQLGNGNTNNSYRPEKILNNVLSIEMNGFTTAAITRNGNLYMWGLNQYGQLGNQTRNDSNIPIKILDNVVSVDVGYTVSAITKDGSLYMWGNNEYGKLGDGTNENSCIPVKIDFSMGSVTKSDISVSKQSYEDIPETMQKFIVGQDDDSEVQPNDVYNFYIMKSKANSNGLAADNLLYINQFVSDDEGKLNISYEIKELYEGAQMFVVGMNQNNITSAQVEVQNLTYNGSEQYINPIVTMNGVRLTEGMDYELSQDYSATEMGEYTVVINGIGNYFGTKSVSYLVMGGQEIEEQVRAFVKRLYTLVLEREAEESGLDSWTKVLLERTSSGVDAGYGFVFSDECKERNLSNEDFVEILYNTFMNRPSDEAGKNAWVSQLNAGVEREKIFEGFVYSDEFAEICSNYRIKVGNASNVDALAEALGHYCNQNADLTKFVARCYTEALGREYDPVGLEDWCRVIVNQEDTPKAVAQSFIFSEEFVEKGLSNEEYVKVLYNTFMGREADEIGLAGWIAVLESGEEDREKVLEGFADSDEFAGILAEFGLE